MYSEGAAIANFNPLKQSGYYTYQSLQHSEALHSARRVKLWVSFDSQNKQSFSTAFTMNIQ
jgi:hypothetical protein